MDIERLIGKHTGQKKGPLLICVGGMHGNEPAGVQALEILFKLLELEPHANPNFTFCGRILGLRGNLRAIREKTRFIDKDLNRLWTPENVSRIKAAVPETLLSEELELRELLSLIEWEIADYQPEKIVLLDLHTTTASGGIFSIATDDPESVKMAVELHAPVVKGMLEGIQGTTLHYFNSENFGRKTVAVGFESGQHNDPLSVNRAIAASINCMRTLGCVRAQDVENRHDALLIEYSKNLPKVLELIMCHSIHPGDKFHMMPDYENFQPVQKGEILAYDRHGPIQAQADGRILMPLYQKKGNDGFFLIRALENGY
ncbi:MAG: succinylglutamate desuccinylase/aspartoacylase family protein [Phaeodactylibacter sp.]|nr:succinylglutamate desuccinylase/aspartoacylase family protein [Phaeodactylibacter sp.]MCB9302316.1 succinylglutamate desuccinylase/aspartoacylase family protein [Lewinellaceae bacterium]